MIGETGRLETGDNRRITVDCPEVSTGPTVLLTNAGVLTVV